MDPSQPVIPGPGVPGVPFVIEDFTEILSYKSDSKWYSRAGYFYVARRSRGASVSMSCASNRCPAHWTLRHGRASPVIGEHDHEPTPWLPNRNAMFQALKRRSTTENIPLNDIYEEEAARYPDAASHLLYEAVVPSMRKWRRSAQPAVPHTLQAYATALQEHPQLSSMLLARVSVAGASAIILVMAGFDRCLGDSDVVVADGTFLTVPAGLPAYQILTLHGVIAGHFFHPVVVLMENRRRALYEAVFTRIWQAAGNPRPLNIITDYEQALRSALVSVTGVQTQGCMFHYVQALLRQARHLGLLVSRNSAGWRLVQLYGSLALLPAARVPLGLAEVRDIARAEGLPFNDRFHEYFESQWMTRVGPEGFSVHGSAHQTSNVAESFHAALKRSLGASPNIWRFTDVIARKFNVCAARMEAQRRGALPRRNRESLYIRATVLLSNSRALDRGTITLREFLVATSRMMDVGVGVVVDAPEVGEEVVIDDLVEVEPEVALDVQEPEVVLEVQEPPYVPFNIRPTSHLGNNAGRAPPQLPRCIICLENPPQLVLIPCGHTQCRSCFDRLSIDTNSCPICRTEVHFTNPLFL